MKRFLSKSKKTEGWLGGEGPLEVVQESVVSDEFPPLSVSKSISTSESQKSTKNLLPMFRNFKESGIGEWIELSDGGGLNLNPSVINVKSSASQYTRESDTVDASVFSPSRKTYSTRQSSYGGKSGAGGGAGGLMKEDGGQLLQVYDMPPSRLLDGQNLEEVLQSKLCSLYEDVSYVKNQFDNSLINLSNAVVSMIECLKTFVEFARNLGTKAADQEWYLTTYNDANLRRIIKIYLHLYDNLLKDDVYLKLKLLLVKNFSDFASTLDSGCMRTRALGENICKPQNFAIGANSGLSLPTEELVRTIMKRIASSSVSIREQDGSFVAPITRGVSKELSILCLYFGYPCPNEYHYKLARELNSLYDDIHVAVMKDQIEPVSMSEIESPQMYTPGNIAPTIPTDPKVSTSMKKFKLPFRVPIDPTHPPISLSLSVENSVKVSGTMGGFIYPKIDKKKQPHLESYSNSKFAISCGHVCLTNSSDRDMEYPYVTSPLSVLISLYKKALFSQYQKFSSLRNDIATTEAKVAYGAVLRQLDEMFPLKKVRVSSSKKEEYEVRNLPKHRFGQIIWGERTLIQATKSENDCKDAEKKLSDLAIIKVNKNLNCDQNFLGDDIAFNEFDPGLMFDNLYVRSVLNFKREFTQVDINEVDSHASSNANHFGLPVFKYGSTTKYTKGVLNGIKLVYWLDGAIQSSEFVIGSSENNTAFAAGGDSGSWILAKLENCAGLGDSKGLGVVGMLHSYDGEQKQFGLFTPMCEILDRLESVTNIKWGVVGVPEKDNDSDAKDELTSMGGSDSYDSSSSYDSENQYESGLEDFDGAFPPEVD